MPPAPQPADDPRAVADPRAADDPSAVADPRAADDPSAVEDPRAVDDPLRRLVAVMDRLRSPGGCPWDAQQTHRSLVPYVLEEAHELVEAIELDDRAGLREELGDLLLQVVFHARVAQEDADDPFDVDDVATDLVDKLVRRHPHVFAEATAASDAEGQHVAWDRLKRAEKQRASSLDGVPHGLGALARSQKLLSRAARAGVDVPLPPDDGSLGALLLRTVAQAQADGLDAEGELRRASAAWEAAVRAAEAGASPGPA